MTRDGKRFANLMSPGRVGDLALPNRILMSPMTRFRITETGVPKPMNVDYYAQRASAGLIISETMYVEPRGRQMKLTAGLYSAEQVAGWRTVTDAVHDAGGRMFAQLFHAGRCSHPDHQPDRATPMAPSSVPHNVLVRIDGPTGAHQKTSAPIPRAMEPADILAVIDEFAVGTKRAEEAGFDGVELHAGSGLLHQQFLSTNSNARADAYGGSAANRCRFVIESLEAMCAVRGAQRVGIKIAPNFAYNAVDMAFDDILETYETLMAALRPMGLAYVHVQYPAWGLITGPRDFNPIDFIRPLYDGPLIGAGEFDRNTAEAALAAGRCDLIAFGRRFIANPDLPKRIELDAPENGWDETTLYSPEAEGFTDYPLLDVARMAVQ